MRPVVMGVLVALALFYGWLAPDAPLDVPELPPLPTIPGLPPIGEAPPETGGLVGLAELVEVGTPIPVPPAPAPDAEPAPPPSAPLEATGADPVPGGWECAGYHFGGRDFCADEGALVVAPVDGTVVAWGQYGWYDTCGGGPEPGMCYGANVQIVNPGSSPGPEDDLEVYMGHLDHETVNPLALVPGTWVEAGTPLGRLSEFPYSRPHTHVQLSRGGAVLGPEAWAAAWASR